ncbi:hypothetical protein ACTI_43120 [Actinoplanes sp. OR16]|uniref:hypothetical protein n=1 Tax=Actinoplanes sp. OR16 TaxID=946334 RepID=UPI000F6F67C7|nr:hypothetical protein [Actinoplanes sp. OR16]BBH67627.1 hypothetical protein ACTI_43120 [Actinoplanes sp. OR16]
MSLEEDLRATLRAEASSFHGEGPRIDMWHNVSAGVRRDRRRRAVLAGGAAAVALGAVVAVPVILANRDGRALPGPPATPGPGSDWVRPSWAAPAFPFEPGWTPPGVGSPVVTVMGANVLLSYEHDSSVLAAETGPIEPSWEAEGEEDHDGEVGGRPATIRTASTFDGAEPGEEFVGVRWRAAGGDWMQVLSWGHRDEDDVLRFARELEPGSVPAGPADVAFALVPPEHSLQHQSDGSLCVAVPEVVTSERQPTGICAFVTDEAYSAVTEAGPEEVTVGGRAASYYTDAGKIDVDLGGGRTLEITWDTEAMPLTRDEAIRFAEGVTVR